MSGDDGTRSTSERNQPFFVAPGPSQRRQYVVEAEEVRTGAEVEIQVTATAVEEARARAMEKHDAPIHITKTSPTEDDG